MPCLGCDQPVEQHQDADGFWRPPLCSRCQSDCDDAKRADAELAQLEARDVIEYDEPLEER